MIHDAVVIGAGPAGSTSARLLAQAGWNIALVEKSSFPRRKVCGEFISATSLPVLEEAGIRDAFLAQAGPEIRRVGLFARDVASSAPMPPAKISSAAWGRALGRESLDILLRDAAVRAGAKLWQPWKLAAISKSRNGHTCALSRDDEAVELEGRIVIAACGSFEPSPFFDRGLQGNQPSDLLAFKANFRHSALPQDLMPLLLFAGGYGGMVHTDSGRISLSYCIRRDVLKDCRRMRPDLRAAEAVLAHILRNCDGAADALSRAQLDGAWLSAGPIRPGIRRLYDGGVFYVGNIAGEAHPIVAEGISMAMQSSWLLSRELMSVQDDFADNSFARAAGAYRRNWKALFARRLHSAALFAQLGIRPQTLAVAVGLVKTFPGLLSWGAGLSGKTTEMMSRPAAFVRGEGLQNNPGGT